MRVKLHLPDSRRVIFSFMMALLLLKMPGTGSKFSGSCYAQQPLQVKEQYLQEVNELFARAKAEQVDIYSPKTFTNARELYQTIISDIEKGDRVEITLRNLNQAKMLLYTALETAHNIKLTLKDLIVLREEAREFPAGQKQSREAFFRAEEAFQYAVLQLEERIERNAQRAVLEAEVSYREVILISLREESLRKATQKLDELQRTISSQNYMELATNLEMAEDLLLQAQTPGIITSDFLSLVEKIKARIQLILNYSVKQDIITELPDLTIEEIDINPTRPHVGENINIRAVVKNLGMAPVSKSLIIFLICGEHELTYTFSRHLGSGQSEELHITTIMPDLDECLITALIDPENRIQESDEQNNRAQLNVTTDAESFTFEEYPEWQMSDLAVIDLTVSPERSNPGDAVKLEATLQNKWKGDTESTSIIFLVDGVMINQVIIPSLAAGAQTKVNTIWKPEAPGQHCITARLKSEEDYVDFNFANNSQIAQAFVSGENNPEPVLSFKEPNFDDLLLQPGESYRLSLKVRNPSFAHIRNIPFIYYIDGERTSAGMIEYLPPGEEQDLQIPWNNVAPGQHIITIKLDLPEDFTNVEFQSLKSWSVVVPDKTVLYTGTRKKHKWFSMGPNILNLKTDTNDMIPDGSTGRMDRIAFHPTNPDILWALAPSGGLWKSENRGDDWKPISDGLPSLIVHAVAIDPKIPDIIYLATRDGYDGQGKGIFKTIDGGASPWVQFAMKNLVGNVNEMVIRYTSSGQVMLYATSDNGVWRYLSNNPKAKQSVTTDWLRIKSGEVVDFAVHPTDHSLVYATVGHREWRGGSYVFVMDGLYRTKKGETAI
ncbi:MAG: CARDB domain-containing protein, partial [Candidatus Hodarchaeota archaeon]